METITGSLESVEPAKTKAGKTYHKVTVAGKFFYDWDGVATKSGLQIGSHVDALYKDGQYPTLKTIAKAEKLLQATVGEAPKSMQIKGLQYKNSNTPSNCKTYLCLKLASEFATGILENKHKDAPVPSDDLQWLENCFKKIKSLWEDE